MRNKDLVRNVIFDQLNSANTMTNTTSFKANDGKAYEILINDEGTEIAVALNNKILGTIELDYRERDFDDAPDYYHVTLLSLDGCPSGVGIGRACLQYHKECFDAPITAGSDNGRKASDGSHLTGAGPGFIQKMREEGLVVSDKWSRWDKYDDEE